MKGFTTFVETLKLNIMKAGKTRQRYEVGDRVRVRCDLSLMNQYDGYFFITEQMYSNRGKIFTIKGIINDGNDNYNYEFDDGSEYWTDGMLEPYDVEPISICFNPIDKTNWVSKRFFSKNTPTMKAFEKISGFIIKLLVLWYIINLLLELFGYKPITDNDDTFSLIVLWVILYFVEIVKRTLNDYDITPKNK